MLANTVRQVWSKVLTPEKIGSLGLCCRFYAVGFANERREKSSKVVGSIEEALEGVEHGAKILFGGFGTCGVPENLIQGLIRKNVRNIHSVSNDLGFDGEGLGKLIRTGQIAIWCGSIIGENLEAVDLYKKGELDITLIPMGTFAERLRAGGAGIPAFYTPTGYGTLVQHGGFPNKLTHDGKIEIRSEPKEFREFNGKRYIMEKGIVGEVSLVKGWKADTLGNIIFRKSARNFNSVMCMAAPLTIAEVEEIVDPGMLDPDEVDLCGIYIQRVVKGPKYDKVVQFMKTQESKMHELDSPQGHIREYIAKRCALEFKSGMYVNLGFGMPLEIADHIPRDITVHIQSENGIMRLGPHPHIDQVDPDIINAGKETASVLPGAAYFGSDEGFAMIRGNHLDITVLGALQVSMYGDLANWNIVGQRVGGMGGAMDLVSAPDTRCIVLTTHNNKDGSPKIVEEIGSKFPLTGKHVIDTIITEKAVFHVSSTGLTLTEYGEGFSVEDIIQSTGCKFEISPDLKLMGQVDA